MNSTQDVLDKAREHAARISAEAYGKQWETLPEDEREQHRRLAHRWSEFLNLETAISGLNEIATKVPVAGEDGPEIRTISGDDAQQRAATALAALTDGPGA